MSNVVITATESQFSVMKNKISIAYFLYDANGKAVPDNITAVKQKITLSYDLYMENTTEDYTDEYTNFLGPIVIFLIVLLVILQ